MASLLRFLVAYTAALTAAATVGKLVPHVRWIAEHFATSLPGAGLAISAVMLAGAAVGPFFGWIVDRAGAKRMTIVGLMIAACAALVLPVVPSYAVLCALRIAEGIGYSFVVVGATIIVVAVSAPARRLLALGMYSSFAPIGFALGQWLGGYADPAAPLGTVGISHALLFVAIALAIAVAIPAGAGRLASPRLFEWAAIAHAPALRSSLAFGCATGVLLGAVALAPLVLAEAHRMTVAEAARLAALAALPGVLGRIGAGWLLETHRLRPLVVISAAALAGTLMLVLAFDAHTPLAAALAAIALFQVCVGAMPGVISAMLPHVTRAPGELGTVAGLANQMIQVGNLIAPPLALGAYAAGGVALAITLIALALAGAVLLVGSLAVFRRSVASAH